jgi:predicted XRE-type DNA-binding protein
MAKRSPPEIKSLAWLGSTKKDLIALPDAVIDTFGYALHLAQTGKKHEQAKPLARLRICGSVGDRGRLARKHLSRRLHGALRGGGRCVARVPEKGQDRSRHPEVGHGVDQAATDGCRAVRKGAVNMSKHKAQAVEVEVGTGNVYADLGYGDADEMLIKAQLVTQIAEIIKRKGLTQTQAAELLGMPQPKLSNLLRGRFRGVSERRLMDCLTKLGRDVEIVVKAAPRSRGSGRLSVVIV